MKKVLKYSIFAFVALFTLLLGSYLLMPQLLFDFTLGQRIILTMEGDEVAHFYFTEEVESDTLIMEGVIYSNTLKDIQEVLTKHPKVTTLTMSNVPGSVDDEINLMASREIRKRGINTYITANGEIASGGTDMFLAGSQRAVHSSAKVGVHSWGTGGDSTALDFPRDHFEHKKYLEYYVEMGIPVSFYWYTLEAAPAENIHWMTTEEMIDYSVITTELDLKELLKIQEELSSDKYEGRETGKNFRAQEIIRNYFDEIGLGKFDSSFNQPFSFLDEDTNLPNNGNNLIGFVKGNTTPNQYIVIGAHYDHLGIREGLVYNGADDNASGTSAMLILSKYFKNNPPDHSIIFCAFDAEEKGLEGSSYFINNTPVPFDDILMNINFDMISRNPKSEIYVVGTYQYPQFRPLVEDINVPDYLTVSYGHDNPTDTTKDYWMNSSDNGPFFEMDIPNITFSEEDHPGYHQPEDDFEYVDKQFFKDVVVLIRSAIQAFDQNLQDLVAEEKQNITLSN